MGVASKSVAFGSVAAGLSGRACVLLAGVGVAGVLVAGGCSSNPEHQDVIADPSPLVMTESLTGDGVLNQTTATIDENWRLFNSDWARFWLMDRPSRLTPAPVR